MCLAQGPQRSDAGEARTRGLLVSSQALVFLWSAEHIRMPFGHFAEILRCPVYTNPYFGGVPLKCVTAYPNVLTLNSNKRRNNQDLFFKLVLKKISVELKVSCQL